MNKSLLNKLKGILGIVLIITSLLAFYYWESHGREKYLYTEVLTFQEDIPRGTTITKELANKNTTIVKVEDTKLIDNAILTTEDIVGLATKQFIPKNAQLHPSYFEMSELILDENNNIFPIPKDWIFAFPSSLRRKDVAYFYPVSFENKSMSNLPTSVFEPIIDEEIEIDKTTGPILKTTIAYVKDGGNREVITVSANERFDGTAVISSIEIVATKEQFNRLKAAYEKGFRFVISYQDNL